MQHGSAVGLPVWHSPNRWSGLCRGLCEERSFHLRRILLTQTPQPVLECAPGYQLDPQPAGRNPEHDGLQLSPDKSTSRFHCTVKVTGTEWCKAPEVPETVM